MLSRALNALAVCAAVLVMMLPSLSAAQSAGSYAIKSGDTLRVEVFEDANLNRNVLVAPDGTISFPLVGTVQARGRTVSQVSAALRGGLAPNFATPPSVHVALAELATPRSSRASRRTVDVFALGEVGEPGRREVKPGITLLQFLAETGGLGQFAADKRIELIRTDEKSGDISTYLFNYRLPQGGGSYISGSTKLQSGDVVKVPQKRLFE